MTEMNRAYQMLSERTQAYIAKRIGAITKMGERRHHLMQSPRKVTSITNALKDPNPEKSILAHEEKTREYLGRKYAGEDEYVKQQEREEWRYVYGKDKFTEKCRIL